MNRFSALAVLALAGLYACDHAPLATLRPGDANLAASPTASSDGITVLDFPGQLWGLNNHGDVVGVAPDGTAFLWADGVTTELHPLAGYESATAWTVNDAGQVVGVFEGPGQYDAFLWEDGNYTLLGPGSAETINNATPALIAGSVGHLAGVWEFDGAGWVPKVLDNDAAVWGSMFGANTQGDVTGSYQFATGELAGGVWKRADAWTLQRIDPLGYRTTVSNAINDAGQVSGWLQSPGEPSVAFLWQDGVTSTLPPLAGHTRSFAYMLNEAGDIAGGSDDEPVFWRNGVPVLLPKPEGAAYCQVVRINDAGQAAGICGFADGRYPVIWTLDAVGLAATQAQIEAFAGNGQISNQGIANSLTSKVESAQAAVASGKPKTAINSLGAFSNQVNAQSGKHIAEPAARSLLKSAQIAIEYLGG